VLVGDDSTAVSDGSGLNCHESLNGASDDVLEPAQSRLSICLNSGDLAFSVPSCWFGCLCFTLVRFSAIPTFMRFYGSFAVLNPFSGVEGSSWAGSPHPRGWVWGGEFLGSEKTCCGFS